MDYIEGLGISNTAWVASYNWGPPMFNSDWTLRCGEGEMGCFVKDTLYLKRNSDQPGGGGDIDASGGADRDWPRRPAARMFRWIGTITAEGDLYGYNVYRSATSGSWLHKDKRFVGSPIRIISILLSTGGDTYFYVVTAVG